jgi:hypothetical protein
MSNPTHDFAKYAFDANDHPDGQAFIKLEPAGKSLEAVGKGHLFLRLRPGVDIKQAEALAHQLNELVDGIEHVR